MRALIHPLLAATHSTVDIVSSEGHICIHSRPPPYNYKHKHNKYEGDGGVQSTYGFVVREDEVLEEDSHYRPRREVDGGRWREATHGADEDRHVDVSNEPMLGLPAEQGVGGEHQTRAEQ